MASAGYTGRIVSYQDCEKEIREIRHAVFIEEQGVPVSVEIDGRDPDSYHVLVYSDDQPVGTARMQKDGHIGRMAVLASHRRNGVGKMMLRLLIDFARTRAIETVFLNAQLYTVPFYEQAGFHQVSAVFYEASMPHVTMEKALRRSYMEK